MIRRVCSSATAAAWSRSGPSHSPSGALHVVHRFHASNDDKPSHQQQQPWQYGPWYNMHALYVSEWHGDVPMYTPTSRYATADGLPILKLGDECTAVTPLPLYNLVTEYFVSNDDARDFGVKIKPEAKRYTATLQFGVKRENLVRAIDTDRPKKFNRFNCRAYLPINVRTQCVFSPAVRRALRTFSIPGTQWWSVWGTKEDYAAMGFEVLEQAVGVHAIDEFGNMRYLIPCSNTLHCEAILSAVHRKRTIVLRTTEHEQMFQQAIAASSEAQRKAAAAMEEMREGLSC